MGVVRVLLLLVALSIVVFSVRRFNFCDPKDVDWLRNTPIAHRGLHDETLEENTLGAFSAAIAGGYAIELDVNLTKDGVPVVVHDNNLSRLTGTDDSVSEMLLEDVKKERLLRSGEKIPTFDEVLSHVDGQVPILIEVKNFGRPGRLESAVLSALEDYSGEYALQSFNPLVCRWFVKRDKNLVVGLLLEDIPTLRYRWVRNLKDNLFSAIAAPSFVAYNYTTLTEEIAQGYRAANVTVLGWGILETSLSASPQRQYVDNVIFDRIAIGH